MKPLSNPYLATLLLTMTAKAAASERLVDPTRPPQARTLSGEPAQATLHVEAVLRSGERDLAIVNGRIVRPGDRIGAALVTEILPDGVRYVHAGQPHVARLQHSSLQMKRSSTPAGSGR